MTYLPLLENLIDEINVALKKHPDESMRKYCVGRYLRKISSMPALISGLNGKQEFILVKHVDPFCGEDVIVGRVIGFKEGVLLMEKPARYSFSTNTFRVKEGEYNVLPIAENVYVLEEIEEQTSVN